MAVRPPGDEHTAGRAAARTFVVIAMGWACWPRSAPLPWAVMRDIRFTSSAWATTAVHACRTETRRPPGTPSLFRPIGGDERVLRPCWAGLAE